jgi:hypothetical protein
VAFTASTLALLVAVHTSSQGRSSFTLDDDGRVAVVVEVSYADVAELCSAPGVLDDDARLSSCLERTLPQSIKLHALDAREHACPLQFDRFEKRDVPGVDASGAKNGTLAMFASADCGAMPDELVVDWGLFFGSTLDHVSVAKLAQPHAPAQLAMLSKRAPRFVLAIAKPHTALIVVVAASCALVLAGIALFVRRRISARAQTRG